MTCSTRHAPSPTSPQRRDLYTQMWQQVVQDDPIIYLWIPKNIVGMTTKLQGFRPVPDGMIRLQGLSMAQ